ncbi:alpha/beta hydrolase [Agrobacterium cavarae]|uniref:alpha/beta hydrolase n=1 Tax=Agrobacterium cavarae TaxID=2528239 RepID=UPI003FD3CB0E
MFPNAVLYALRGAVTWENGYAFFRRKPDRQIDVDDLKAQATRLCMFMDFVIRQTGQTPFLVGYSNGAIMASEVLCQNGSMARGAILMRPLSPRRHEELPSLSGVPVLLLAAKHDERRAENDARRTTRVIWPTSSLVLARMFVSKCSRVVTAGRKTQPMRSSRVSGWQLKSRAD